MLAMGSQPLWVRVPLLMQSVLEMRGAGLGRSAEILDISTIFLPTRHARWWS
jgi:hypothetical protein